MLEHAPSLAELASAARRETTYVRAGGPDNRRPSHRRNATREPQAARAGLCRTLKDIKDTYRTAVTLRAAKPSFPSSPRKGPSYIKGGISTLVPGASARRPSSASFPALVDEGRIAWKRPAPLDDLLRELALSAWLRRLSRRRLTFGLPGRMIGGVVSTPIARATKRPQNSHRSSFCVHEGCDIHIATGRAFRSSPVYTHSESRAARRGNLGTNGVFFRRSAIIEKPHSESS